MQNPEDSSKYIERRDSIELVSPHRTKLNESDSVSSSVVSVTDTKSSNKEPEVILTRKEKTKLVIQYLKPLVTMLFIDVALSLIIYYVLKRWLSLIVALVLSGIPPLIHIAYKFWKKRKVDVLGCIIVISFVLSAILSLVSGK